MIKFLLVSFSLHVVLIWAFLAPEIQQQAELYLKPAPKLSVTIKKNLPKKKLATASKALASKESSTKPESHANKAEVASTRLEEAESSSSDSVSGNQKASLSKNYPPVYPEIAKELRQEGTVLLAAEVLEEGSVGEIKVISSSGYRLLDEAAVKALKKWHYIPAQSKGEAVVTWLEQPIRFQLN